MNNRFKHIKKTALLSALLLEISTGAQAATIHVDNSSCTLADAIESANSDTATGGCIAGDVGADVIELPNNANIVLTSVLTAIISDITLNANGSTIKRDQTAPKFTVLRLAGSGGTNLTVNDATISGGQSTSYGNRGGGIYASSGNLTINRSQITGNMGSGVSLVSTNVTINDSVISNNQGLPRAYYGAAGLFVIDSNLSLNNSTIANNTNQHFAQGGGIVLGYASTASITNSTISGNSTESGAGGIHVYSNGSIFNTTVELYQVTLTNNSTLENGGAIYNDGADVTITQSLITGNFAGNAVDEILNGGTFTSNGYNLIGLNGYSSSVFIDLDFSDEVITESNLSDVLNPILADNGGPTPTHTLNPNGPAVDFVPPGSCHSLTDQTGKTRPIGSGCDVGAFEFEYTDVIFKDGFD